MQAVLIAIHLIIVSIMIGVILLQKSEGGGLGIGSTGGFLSSRGTANVLTRTTAILAATFFATSLVLSVLAGMDRKPRAIIQNTGGAPTQQAPGAPAGQGGGGLLDTLRQREQPAAPATPSGPQVPQSQ
jgi:preprotein translocase subunit SecG